MSEQSRTALNKVSLWFSFHIVVSNFLSSEMKCWLSTDRAPGEGPSVLVVSRGLWSHHLTIRYLHRALTALTAHRGSDAQDVRKIASITSQVCLCQTPPRHQKVWIKNKYKNKINIICIECIEIFSILIDTKEDCRG